MLTLMIKLKMKMSTGRRLSARKSSKRQTMMAATHSLNNNTHKDVVRKIELERVNSRGGVGGGGGAVNLDKTTSSTETADSNSSALEAEYEAIKNNWSRFVGYPMQVLLLVR